MKSFHSLLPPYSLAVLIPSSSTPDFIHVNSLPIASGLPSPCLSFVPEISALLLQLTKLTHLVEHTAKTSSHKTTPQPQSPSLSLSPFVYTLMKDQLPH